MANFIFRWIINAAALYAAIFIVPGIHPSGTLAGQWWAIFLLALIFGLLNAILRPLIYLLTCPLIILTLGLGTLLINTLLFYLTGLLGRQFGFGFTVDGFLAAFFGALVVSVVSFILNLVLKDEQR